MPERTRFTDFTVDLTFDMGEASDVAAGLIFRSQGGLEVMYETYVLFIMPEGYFGLARSDDEGNWHYLQPTIATSIRPSRPVSTPVRSPYVPGPWRGQGAS